MRIILAEDDVMIGETLSGSLKAAGYACDWVEDGLSLISAVAAQTYDLVLLDLGLPKQDGLQALAQLRRSHPQLPVIILTARDDLDSRISGLDGGADDYLIKPFDFTELTARIRAVLRRRHGTPAKHIDNGLLVLDTESCRATRKDSGQTVQLSPREFALLHTLMQQGGRIFSRSELEDKLYSWGEEPESNAIDFLIHALRKKIGADAIKNVRGLGWLTPKQP